LEKCAVSHFFQADLMLYNVLKGFQIEDFLTRVFWKKIVKKIFYVCVSDCYQGGWVGELRS